MLDDELKSFKQGFSSFVWGNHKFIYGDFNNDLQNSTLDLEVMKNEFVVNGDSKLIVPLLNSHKYKEDNQSMGK